LSAIKVGDLVQVVRPRRCGCVGRLGKVFAVLSVHACVGNMKCAQCGEIYPAIAYAQDEIGKTYDIERLKRIPPISELEGARDALPERTLTKEKA
jgi:hypothetical protein